MRGLTSLSELSRAGRRLYNRARPVDQSERGDAMIVWCLLLALMLLPLGGLTIDLWRGIAAQRSLQSAAEDAATAAASGIDVQQYRATGCLVLEPSAATSLAEANLASQHNLGPLATVDISGRPADLGKAAAGRAPHTYVPDRRE
jgi:Flp pilus assembly protein TadG